MFWKLIFLAVGAVLVVGLSGCSGDGNPLAPTGDVVDMNITNPQQPSQDLGNHSLVNGATMACADFAETESDTTPKKPIPEPEDVTWSYVQCLFR